MVAKGRRTGPSQTADGIQDSLAGGALFDLRKQGRSTANGNRESHSRAGPIAFNAGMEATSMKELATEAVAGARPRDLYFEDAWSWSREQAAALRRRDFAALDWDDVIEEIEDVGNRHYDRWISNCGNAITHLLKIEHYRSPEDVNHWRREVLGYRQKMYRTLRRHRGMKGSLGEMLAEAWGDGRDGAVDQMADCDARDDPRGKTGGRGAGRPGCPRSARAIATTSSATTHSTRTPSRAARSGPPRWRAYSTRCWGRTTPCWSGGRCKSVGARPGPRADAAEAAAMQGPRPGGYDLGMTPAEYVRQLYEPGDRVAVVLIPRDAEQD